MIDGSTDGLSDGVTEGAEEGAEVGVGEGGPEMHVGRPVPAHSGYTQAGVEAKGVVPNELIPAQFSMMTIVS